MRKQVSLLPWPVQSASRQGRCTAGTQVPPSWRGYAGPDFLKRLQLFAKNSITTPTCWFLASAHAYVVIIRSDEENGGNAESGKWKQGTGGHPAMA